MKIFFKILLVFFLTIISCRESRVVSINEQFIHKLALEDMNYPSYYGNLIFFCRYSNNEVLRLDIHELREIYQKKYKSISYYDFLFEALNQKLDVTFIFQDKKFQINKTIEKSFKKMKINEFVNFYCTKYEKDNEYILKNGISKDQINTILYFLFLNNFIAGDDDYIGIYRITKISSYVK